MMRQTVICRYCGGEIREHVQVFDHITCEPGRLTPEQWAEVAAMERRLQERLVERRLMGTGITVKRGAG
jgi:hypothetical protein